MGENFVAANGDRSLFLFMIARWACIAFSWIGAIGCYLWGKGPVRATKRCRGGSNLVLRAEHLGPCRTSNVRYSRYGAGSSGMLYILAMTERADLVAGRFHRCGAWIRRIDEDNASSFLPSDQVKAVGSSGRFDPVLISEIYRLSNQLPALGKCPARKTPDTYF